MKQRSRVLFLALLLATGSCGGESAGSAIDSSYASDLATCGGRAFPLAALEGPEAAELATGPEFDALREAIRTLGSDFPPALTATWRLVGKDAGGATFLAYVGPRAEVGAWIRADVAFDGRSWTAASMGTCDPRVVLPGGSVPADWNLDPAFPSPTATTESIHVLIWDPTCSDGQTVQGRVVGPIVQYRPDSLVVTIGVRSLEGDGPHGCDQAPGSSIEIRLSSALGDRTILDGNQIPPGPPNFVGP